MFYKILKFIIRPIIFLLYRPRVEGLENFPKQGKTIIYSNHISLLDPIILGCILPRQIFFMAKVELFKNPLFRGILKQLGAFPVKRGAADLSAIKNSLQVLKQGKVFGIFPEGTRSKNGEILPFSHGIASIAHKSKAQIVPVAILGNYKPFRRLKIIIGEQLDFDDYFKRKSNTQLLEEMAHKMSLAIIKLVNK